MKVSELTQIIENTISDEIKKTILEMEKGTKEVYHIKCEGVPLATFETEKEAKEALPSYKEKHDGELIIEKGVYESHDDMIEKFEEMNDKLEETDNMENIEKTESKAFAHAVLEAKEDGKETFEFDGKTYNVDECWKQLEEEEVGPWNEEECNECGEKSMEEKLVGNQDKLDKDKDGKITKKDFEMMRGEKEETNEGKGMCNECGSMLNEEGMCMECGTMKESKRVVRLSESEMVQFIKNIVKESVPGLTVTKKAQGESAKYNKEYAKEVESKMKKARSFDGNDNPEFPKPIGKGDKVARQNTKEQDEEIAKNFAGLENLNYDIEPNEQFKKRLKMAIEGDKLMGNAPTTDKTDVKPSNGASLGKESEHKSGNSVETPTAKKMEKQMKDRGEDLKNRTLYNKERVPVKTSVNETKVNFDSILNEEIKKMKSLESYNKKTQ